MASLWGSALNSGDPAGSKGLGIFNVGNVAAQGGVDATKMPTTVNFPWTSFDPSGGATASGTTSKTGFSAPGVNLGTSGGAYGSSGAGGFGLASEGGGGAAVGGGNPVTEMGSPYTGFASRYMPGSAEMLFSNPDVILRDTLRDMGRMPDQGLYYMLEPLANAGNALFAMSVGGGTDLGAGSNEAGINFINDYLRNQATVGGNAVDYNAGMAALNNYAPGSAMDAMLNLASPEEQISNYRGLYSALANTSLHPVLARAANSQLDARGTDYMSSVARGEAQSNFGNYLASRQGMFQVA